LNLATLDLKLPKRLCNQNRNYKTQVEKDTFCCSVPFILSLPPCVAIIPLAIMPFQFGGIALGNKPRMIESTIP
jgi:hypothetical protein